MFDCPHCVAPLGRVLKGGANYWQCPVCGGHAINLSVLRRRSEAGAVNRLWQGALKPGRGSGFSCPSCKKNMKAVALELERGAFEVDVCQQCQFLWFDRNELRSVPLGPEAPVEKPLPPAAREALAMAKVERIREEAERSTPDGPDDAFAAVAGFLGMPAEEERGPLRRHPVVTWSVAALVVLVSVVVFLRGREALTALAFIPAEPWRWGGLTMLTSFFVHGGVWHLVGNLYFLISFGDNVEDLIGRRRFLAVLWASTLVGDVLHWMLEPRGEIPTVGASGGISGIIALYALAFPEARLGMYMGRGYFMRWVTFSAKWGFVCWLGLQFITAYLQTQGGGSVSGLAHLGGAVVGVGYWFVWSSGRTSRVSKS